MIDQCPMPNAHELVLLKRHEIVMGTSRLSENRSHRTGRRREVLYVSRHASRSRPALCERLCCFLKFGKVLKSSETYLDVQGLLSQFRACSVSVAASGVLFDAGKSIDSSKAVQRSPARPKLVCKNTLKLIC